MKDLIQPEAESVSAVLQDEAIPVAREEETPQQSEAPADDIPAPRTGETAGAETPETGRTGKIKKQKSKKPEGKDSEKVNVSFASNVFELVSVFVSALVVVAVVFVFVARPVGVNGSSMLPTLENGDWLLVSPLYGEPEYGDIIVSYPPSAFNEPLVKRVIALGGQEVNIDTVNGIVYVDGIALDETAYVNTPTTRTTEFDRKFPLTVQDGYVFMCGDNRNGSTDSRTTLVGDCREEYILGKAICRVVPFGSLDIYESFREAVGK